jgi:hypothetical protein
MGTSKVPQLVPLSAKGWFLSPTLQTDWVDLAKVDGSLYSTQRMLLSTLSEAFMKAVHSHESLPNRREVFAVVMS